VSDLLVHWAVFDDCRRLATLDDAVEEELTRVMNEQKEYARLGAITRSGRHWIPYLLRQSRSARGTAAESDQRRLAFALGGITHYAADAIMKGVMRVAATGDENAGDTRLTPGSPEARAYKEASAYYDLWVFREVYLSGHVEPFNSYLLMDNATTPGVALEEFVRALFQRALLSSHTLDAVGAARTGQEFESWLENLFRRIQPLYMDIRQYVRIFTEPDRAKETAYGVRSRFYQKDDPLIRIARDVQHACPVSEDDLKEAMRPGVNQSAYARVLELAMIRLREASAFWRGEADTVPDVAQ
jgi:hypothetical protein